MTLAEKVAQTDGICFVGAANGFFFIGDKERYQQDISEINKFYKDSMLRLRLQNELRLLSLEMAGEPKGDVIKRRAVGLTFKDLVVPHEEAVVLYYKQIERVKRAIKKFTDAVDNWVDLEDREVKDSCVRPCEHDGTVIVVDGIEHGRYWMKEEYDTGIVEESTEVEEYGE